MPKHFLKQYISIIWLASIILLSSGCQSESERQSDVAVLPTGTKAAESLDETPHPPSIQSNAESTAEIPATATITPTDTPDILGSIAIDNAEAARLMDTLLTGGLAEVETALDHIVSAEDERFIAVLIDSYRGYQIGLIETPTAQPIIDALEELSGQTFAQDWPAWVEWYGKTDLEPPPGFTGWKGRMLSRIDPRFGEFLQDRHPSDLRPEEIQWGGVVVDGIPALDNPRMLPSDKASYLNPEDAVFGISVNGESRAYPLRILDWHEMANDVVGGVPVSLAYCTLCGAAIAYNGLASDGNTYTFGSSGFLYRSNKLMYDRQTRTLWNQLTGEPVLGELVDSEISLDLLPVVLTTWQEWQNQHPDTLVLDIDTGFPRNYTAGAAYGNYFAGSDTMFPVAQRSGLLPPKSQIYAVRTEGIPKAYPLQDLADKKIINDTIAGTNLVLMAPNGLVEVAGENQYVGEVNYQVGGEVRAYARDSHTFSPGPVDNALVDGVGDPWQITEDALLGPNGELLPRIPGHLAYWFGWYAFFPNTLVYSD